MSTSNSLPISGIDSLPAIADLVLAGGRADALKRFENVGLPTHRTEAWKYTVLRGMDDGAFRLSRIEDGNAKVAPTPVLADDEVAARLIFVNGQLRLDLSKTDGLPDGASLASLAEMTVSDPDWLKTNMGEAADGVDDGLLSLNAAAMSGGYVLSIERSVTIEKPIEIINLATGSDTLAWSPRNLVVLGENAEASIVVSYVGGEDGSFFVNAVNEFLLGADARLKVYGLEDSGKGMTRIVRTFARLSRNAQLATFGLNSGVGLYRHEQTVLLEGEGADARLDGGYLLRGKAHCDNTTRIEHRVPNTTCNEVFKGVVDDTARAVFQGKIVVAKDAQHTDGRMLNKTLLLSDKAEIDTKPELEIYADDVQCAHGATSGKIDETALFYLRSRGIPDRLARNLLVRSFLGEATERITHEGVRDIVAARIEQWLPETAVMLDEEQAA